MMEDAIAAISDDAFLTDAALNTHTDVAEFKENNNFAVKASIHGPVHTLGLFTKRAIPKLTVVAEYRGESFSVADWNRRRQGESASGPWQDQFLRRFKVGRGSYVIDASDPRKASPLRYLQRAILTSHANGKLVQRGGRLFFVTTEDVEPGCELLECSPDAEDTEWTLKVEDMLLKLQDEVRVSAPSGRRPLLRSAAWISCRNKCRRLWPSRHSLQPT